MKLKVKLIWSLASYTAKFSIWLYMKLMLIALEKEKYFNVLKFILFFIYLYSLQKSKISCAKLYVLATVLLHTTQSNFLHGVITSENNLKGKIKMEWNDWPLSIFLKHLQITISHIKPSLMMKVAVMSDMVNTPSHCWVNEHWKKTFELMVNDKSSWLKQFMLISLAPFLLAVWVKVERALCGSAGSAGPGFALGFFWFL